MEILAWGWSRWCCCCSRTGGPVAALATGGLGERGRRGGLGAVDGGRARPDDRRGQPEPVRLALAIRPAQPAGSVVGRRAGLACPAAVGGGCPVAAGPAAAGTGTPTTAGQVAGLCGRPSGRSPDRGLGARADLGLDRAAASRPHRDRPLGCLPCHRDRDLALPAVRHRPAHQPHLGVWTADRWWGRGVCRGGQGAEWLLAEGVGLGGSLVATAVIAVSFAPARDRLQRWVDRRLYGERHDPVRAMARLGERLRVPPGMCSPRCCRRCARPCGCRGHPAGRQRGGGGLRPARPRRRVDPPGA